MSGLQGIPTSKSKTESRSSFTGLWTDLEQLDGSQHSSEICEACSHLPPKRVTSPLWQKEHVTLQFTNTHGIYHHIEVHASLQGPSAPPHMHLLYTSTPTSDSQAPITHPTYTTNVAPLRSLCFPEKQPWQFETSLSHLRAVILVSLLHPWNPQHKWEMCSVSAAVTASF